MATYGSARISNRWQQHLRASWHLGPGHAVMQKCHTHPSHHVTPAPETAASEIGAKRGQGRAGGPNFKTSGTLQRGSCPPICYWPLGRPWQPGAQGPPSPPLSPTSYAADMWDLLKWPPPSVQFQLFIQSTVPCNSSRDRSQ